MNKAKAPQLGMFAGEAVALYLGALLVSFLLSQAIQLVKFAGYGTMSLYIWVLLPVTLSGALIFGSGELAKRRGSHLRNGWKPVLFIAASLIFTHLCLNAGGVWYVNHVVGTENLFSPMDDIPLGGIIVFGPNVLHAPWVALEILKRTYFFVPGPLILVLVAQILREKYWVRV